MRGARSVFAEVNATNQVRLLPQTTHLKNEITIPSFPLLSYQNSDKLFALTCKSANPARCLNKKRFCENKKSPANRAERFNTYGI